MSRPTYTGLSPREEEIVQLVATGHKNGAIAERLCIALGTVNNHLESIKVKLGTRDRGQLTLYAVQHGLLEVEAVV